MIVILWILNSLSLYYLIKSYRVIELDIKIRWTLICVFQLFITIMTIQNPQLLTVYYLCIYFSKKYTYSICNTKNSSNYVFASISSILILSCHLIYIAFLALYYKLDMNHIINNSQFITYSFMVLLVVDIIINIISAIKHENFIKLFQDSSHQQYRNFEYFLWFGYTFLVVQSILSQYDRFPIYVSIFLICNDSLLLILVSCFLKNIYDIKKQLHVEKENEFLQAESEKRRKNMNDLRKSADFDILTKAYSRKYTFNYLENLKRENIPFSIIFIDLDRLKYINDNYGHTAGDQYLRSFAESIEVFLESDDILGRIGGDEFLLVIKYKNKNQSQEYMDYICNKLLQNIYNDKISFSYGIATFENEKQDIKSLIKEADIAMYQNKKEKKRREDNAK